MSSLDNIVQVTISRQTQAVSRTGFGTPAIIAEFDTAKTTLAFERYRTYASLTEMVDDGWLTTDAVYESAALIFSQNPKPNVVMIGRKDSGDADWSTALTAIQVETQDWYTFSIIASNASTTVFDVDFVASNSIVFTINGVTVTAVPFNADQATTMADLKTQIEADITDSLVTIDPTDVNTRTLIVEIFGQEGVLSTSVVVTGGATQPVGSVTFINEDDYKDVASWAETQKKIFFYCSSSDAIKNAGSTSDIAYFMQAQNYDRTVSCFHIASQGDADPAYFETGWVGESLPYDPGSQTWAYKTIAALASYGLTSSERTAILNKNCNIYTRTAGIDITEQGKVASGEYIDIIRGLDWLEARLQEAVFTNLINVRKIPFTDEGITVIASTVQGILEEAARQGILVLESIEVTAPLAVDVSQADKVARNLPDIDFVAVLQGAIHTVEINGVVTV